MENLRKNQIFWHNFFFFLFPALVFLAVLILKNNDVLPQEIPPFDFFILSLAVYRLIRLVTYDDITEHFRGYLKRYESGFRRELWSLLDCPWCSGVWAAFLISFLYFLTPWAWYPILVLALAGAGTFIQLTILKIGKDL